jgi:hypothetical protein
MNDEYVEASRIDLREEFYTPDLDPASLKTGRP